MAGAGTGQQAQIGQAGQSTTGINPPPKFNAALQQPANTGFPDPQTWQRGQQGQQQQMQQPMQPAQQQYAPAVMPPSYGTPVSGGKGGLGGLVPQQGLQQQMQQPMQQLMQQGMQQQQPAQQAAVGMQNEYTKYGNAQQPAQQPASNQPQPPNIFSTAAQGMNQGIKTAGMETMYRPQTIAGTDLSAYTNPYESQVVNQSLQDLERARQMQANQLGAQASGAGAFGGSRQAIMESELGRNYLDQAARTASGLRQAGFQNAQQLAGQDIGFGLAGSQNRQAAANTLGNLSNLGFGQGMELSNQAWQQGGLAQGINQMLIDAAKGQYAGYQGAPAQSLGYMAQALGATPTPTTTTQSRQPGLFDYLTLGATALGGR